MAMFKRKKHRRIDLGLVKVEHRFQYEKKKPKFISIERTAQPYKPSIESRQTVNIAPRPAAPQIRKEELSKQVVHKPKRFMLIVDEIRSLFTNIIFFNAILTSILLFFLSYLVLMVLNLNVLHSIWVPSLYFVVYIFIKFRKNKYLEVEKRFPQLNEKIRTAVDNVYLENPVVDELRDEITVQIKEADYGSFFKEKSTSYQVLLILLLGLTILFLAKYDVSYNLDLKDRVMGFIDGGEGNATGIVSDIISAATSGPDDDIFGDEQLAELGEEEMTIKMDKVGYEINMDDVKDPSYKDFEQSLFPDDIGLEKSEVYVQKDLKENKELVKNYFKNMAQG